MEEITSLHKKIKFEESPTLWNHHRGGWSHAFQTLQSMYAPDGVLCVSAVEELICNEQIIDELWIGFIHQAPRNNYKWYPDLEQLVKSECFIKSLKNCCGLFTLSSVVKSFLVNNLSHPNIPVTKIFYPATPFPEQKKFNWDKYNKAQVKRVIFIGEYLRKYQSIFDLKIQKGYQKYLLKAPDVDFNQLLNCSKQTFSLKMNESVIIIPERISNEEYDDLLSSSIVFLDLYDAVANTTVIECLSRNTPLVVNRLPGIEEYLGVEYPLFYDTLEEAATIFENKSQLESGVAYFKERCHAQLTVKHFLEAFHTSSIYRLLPLPSSQQQDVQQTKFPSFDLSVVVCCYERVYNLKYQLECFKQQDYCGRFELILWNNNAKTHKEVASIAAPYLDELNIRLIQSTANYYCIIRLAIARLMQSNLLLICDDDVIPKPRYISTFVAKYKEYGPRVALCCRGHVFIKKHSLSEEEPHKFWESYENEVMKFCHQKLPDRQVHFMHADNCLIPRCLLLEIGSYDMTCPDYILVDDYWISFVLSHHLQVPLWKIKGDEMFYSTPCADDESIALYHNKAVREQRVNFYVYHMRQGWPNNVL